ncbi:hypothetical protein C5167_049790 [Papaver somniferum]|uniref:Uncharacterized protein n=1 Tax=Papaver somniferum TaxID=3469 RepID=A0A4Y7KQ96_PAPSO|nr:protein ENDOSPERM DEFECTIVE 1-like [Papaver somniferum]RZC74308.1 hypothetical protein C5167_049790 [Papaver somniferum]
MTEVSSFSQEQQKQQQNVVTAPHPPRRPRVREVSSRFMSPMVSTSSSSGDLHLPSSAKCPLPKHSGEFQSKHHHQSQNHSNQNQQRSLSAQRRQQETEPLSSADENRLDVMRNLDTPHSKLVISTQQRKPQRSLKLFKENNGGGGGEDTVNLRAFVNGKLPGRSTVVRSRSDTPIVHGNDRINPRSAIPTQNSHRSDTSMVSAAAKLVQSQVSSSVSSDNDDNKFIETLTESSASSDCSESGSCCSSPMIIQKSKIRSFPECRSSMPEADQLPTISNRLLTNRGNSGMGDSSKIGLSPIYRSLSFEQPPFTSPTKTLHRTTTGFAKPHQSSAKPPGSVVSLPPHPSSTVAWADTKKGRKILSQQENVHSLKMLHNRYLQWRYANARAAISVNAQTTAAQQSLYGLASQVSKMRDSIKAKRADFENLKRREALSAILEAQIPHLDEWSALKGDYLNSLVGAIKALQDASLRLPIGGNVRADLKELDGALNSASNMMESISSNFESFVPKAEQMDSLVSELAAVASEERALIEECGDLLSHTQNLQVEECSLRGQLMQLKKNSSLNQAKEE